jgi:DNA repair protein RadC
LPILKTLLGDKDREEFLILMVDAKNKIIGIHSVSVGTLSLTVVHPREVFKAAILVNSSAIILAHNHPSGDPNPSREDITLTKRMEEAGKILGIRILDHIILGEESFGNYYSFADSGMMDKF